MDLDKEMDDQEKEIFERLHKSKEEREVLEKVLEYLKKEEERINKKTNQQNQK